MEQSNINSLIAELRAIELWDHFYMLCDIHDFVDTSAWSNRRERQSVIYKQLVDLRVLETCGASA